MNFWVLLLVQAKSEDEAIEAVKVHVKPEIRTPLNRPKLHSKGVYPVEVYVPNTDLIRNWGNAYNKDSEKPGLLEFFAL